MNLKEEILEIGKKSLLASRELNKLSSEEKTNLLLAIAEALFKSKERIKSENEKDLKQASALGLSSAMIDRLKLDDARIEGMIQGIKDVASLEDPIGRELKETIRPNGLVIKKVSVPIGVIAIIYESRPNVTIDTAALCLKSSNSVILRGGKEAINSNKILADIVREVLPEKLKDVVQLIESTDREGVKHLVQLEGIVDMAIPRGGEGLIRAVTDLAKVPVLKHYKGVCHIYVEKSADLEMAENIIVNAKCQRPGVCNAMETLLVDEVVSKNFIPKIAEVLNSKGVELRGDKKACELSGLISEASESDWDEEYLDLILSIKLVKGIDDAISHINRHGSRHSDAIVTNDEQAQARFLRDVDSSAVFVNSSTRFNDGGEFGLGAELGISTDKLHARGPMGLEEMTTYKYLVFGKGQIR